MYGLVNRALEDLITHKYGEEKWLEVRDKAKVEIDAFEAAVTDWERYRGFERL